MFEFGSSAVATDYSSHDAVAGARQQMLQTLASEERR
jgi:hypothetical protein